MPIIQLDDLTQPKPANQELVEMTPAAIDRVTGMLATRPELAGKGLRIYVAPGGCAGSSYGMAFDDPAPDDTVVECGGLKVLLDEESLPWLKGIHIDFKETMLGSGFAVTNPNALSTCGCGTSFSKGDGTDAGSTESCH